MRVNVLDDTAGERVFMVVFDIGDEVAGGLLRFADDYAVDGASFTGLGAFRRAELAWWSWDAKVYESIPVEAQVEVLSLVGNVAQTADGGRKVHAHTVVGFRDGRTLGGHLQSGEVRPTLEVTVRELPAALLRREDEVTGLQLLEP